MGVLSRLHRLLVASATALYTRRQMVEVHVVEVRLLRPRRHGPFTSHTLSASALIYIYYHLS